MRTPAAKIVAPLNPIYEREETSPEHYAVHVPWIDNTNAKSANDVGGLHKVSSTVFQGSFSTKSKSAKMSPLSKKAYRSTVNEGYKSPSEMDMRSADGSRMSNTRTKVYTKQSVPKAKDAAPRNRKRWG